MATAYAVNAPYTGGIVGGVPTENFELGLAIEQKSNKIGKFTRRFDGNSGLGIERIAAINGN